MTKEEIIRMAREARLGAFHLDDGATIEALERFAALVAEAEGKRLAWACEQARFEDGDGQHVEWYKGFDYCAAVLNAESVETK